MQSGSRKVQIASWASLGAVLVLVVVLFAMSRAKSSGLPKYDAVLPFTLTNQLGERVTAGDLLGKVWVADIIFTRCAGPCPKMTDQMSTLQGAFDPGAPLRFVSLTTDPEYDTPRVLRAYAGKFRADAARWFFLTGPKEELLANVAVKSLKLSAVEKEAGEQDDPNDLFIHSTIFVLVDKGGRIRGYYESSEPGFQEKMRADIQSLLGEAE